jgi:hypothetical protein
MVSDAYNSKISPLVSDVNNKKKPSAIGYPPGKLRGTSLIADS